MLGLQASGVSFNQTSGSMFNVWLACHPQSSVPRHPARKRRTTCSMSSPSSDSRIIISSCPSSHLRFPNARICLEEPFFETPPKNLQVARGKLPPWESTTLSHLLSSVSTKPPCPSLVRSPSRTFARPILTAMNGTSDQAANYCAFSLNNSRVQEMRKNPYVVC